MTVIGNSYNTIQSRVKLACTTLDSIQNKRTFVLFYCSLSAIIKVES